MVDKSLDKKVCCEVNIGDNYRIKNDKLRSVVEEYTPKDRSFVFSYSEYDQYRVAQTGPKHS